MPPVPPIEPTGRQATGVEPISHRVLPPEERQELAERRRRARRDAQRGEKRPEREPGLGDDGLPHVDLTA